jgi:hypothetical protein
MRIREIQAEFTLALPRIERHAAFAFRHLACVHARQECIAEVSALAWSWWLRLRRRGRNPNAFASTIATFAARAVRSGRRLCGQERARDAHSPQAQRRHDFRLERLPQATRSGHERLYGSPTGQSAQDAFEERLRDNTQTPVPEQVAFRLDFPRWLQSHERRNRRLIERMMRGEITLYLAKLFRLSPARVSQLRREFLTNWQAYQGDRV